MFWKFLVAGFVLLAFAGSREVDAQERPNILWIFVEDLSPFIGCYGDPVNTGHTPALDRLGAEGVVFRRTFMPAPVCSACRSAIISGVMQTTTGTHHHRSSRFADGQVVPEELRIRLPEGMRTIPERFRDAGWFTFNCGKDDYNFHYDRRTLYSVGTRDDYVAGMNGWQGNFAADYDNWRSGNWTARPDRSQPWFGQIMLWGGKARDRFVRDGERLPVDALEPPPYFPDTPAQREAWTTHYNAVRGTDHQVEQIVRQLEADGELERTVIFFFSDHGSDQSLRHKQYCYEGGVHVPLIVWGNHKAILANTVRDDLVSGLDIPATTLALAGIEVPHLLDGQDLFASNFQPREFVVSARDRCDFTIDRIRTVRTDRFRYIRNFMPDRPMLQAQYRDPWPVVEDLKRLRDERTLTEWMDQYWFGDRAEEELYDLSSDPHQIYNLADEPQWSAELARHRSILDQWMAETSDAGQQPEAAIQLRSTYEFWKDRPVFQNAPLAAEYLPFAK